jgi:hypothetical protein
MEILADSSVVERWTLPNGLRVTTRHVPKLRAVAVTVAYRVGTDDDPPGRAGLAQVTGELGFTAATADAPDRNREELDSQRPLGWGYPVNRRITLFTEIAAVERFPGVLSQVASRMKGVQVTPEGLRAAIATVQREIAERETRPELSLTYNLREIALGRTNEQIALRGSGEEIAKLGLEEVQERLRHVYVPANASLGLVGDLRRVDVRRLVDNLFASIPPGTPLPVTELPRLQPVSRVVARPGGSVGAIGVIAPALDDSLHPTFYASTLLLGSHVNNGWQVRGQDPEPRFQYPLFDEPDLPRFYPPLDPSTHDPAALTKRFLEAGQALSTMIIPKETYEEVKKNALWVLGGPMTEAQLSMIRRESGALMMLATSQATRALLGGDAFWDRYRRRLDALEARDLGAWDTWYHEPSHQVRLLFAAPK